MKAEKCENADRELNSQHRDSFKPLKIPFLVINFSKLAQRLFSHGMSAAVVLVLLPVRVSVYFMTYISSGGTVVDSL